MGKEKLAGAQEKTTGMDLLNAPVALERACRSLSEKDGTRGMVTARKMPILHHQENMSCLNLT